MKHLTLLAGLVASLSLPVLAQPGPGGPVQLRNPHRRGGDGPMGGGGMPMGGGGTGGGFSGRMPGIPGGGFGDYVPPVAPIVAPPSVAMFADGPYLFALRGDSLFQFDKKALKLLNSAELPRPTAITVAPTTTVAPPAVAISTDGSLLFVMRGDSLFQFDKKTLKLLNSADLPAPAAPSPASATTGQADVLTHTSPPLRPGPDFKNGPTF